MFPTSDAENISQVTSDSVIPKTPIRDATETPQSNKPSSNRELTFNMLIKELVFCIALALTTYGALHNSPTKVSKHPQAVRFFSQDSVVTDWYKGQLISALAAINKADISFVMYYAPWDAECQYVKREFEKAAEVLYDRVHFSAVNCWNPGSECRLQHSKIPSWPIIMAYTVTSKGVLYKGPRDAQSMINFLELIMYPIRRVSSTEDLVNLLSICDAVAVGYTPLLDSSQYYNVWYNVALKVREMDTIGEICFGAVTSDDLAVDLGVESVPNARLMLWNETKEYHGNIRPWNESALVEWLLENFSQPVARIIPMWRKAFSFERYIDGNPILILFTPLNPLYEQLPNYALLREVAMEYYNCKDNETSQWISELIKLQQVQRLLYQQRDIRKFCRDHKSDKPLKPAKLFRKELISHHNKYPWNNTTNKSQKTSFFNFLLKRGLAITKAIESSDNDARFLSNLDFFEECSTNMFPAEKDYYEQEKCQTLDKVETDYVLEDKGTSMLPLEDDPFSAENLMQDRIKHYCKLMKFAHSFGEPVLPARDLTGNYTHVHGLACAKNFSLYMIAVDSVRNHHFAESLGIDVLNKKDKTSVVILDSKHESQYVLLEDYSAKSIREFIYNYTHQKLKRTLRTQLNNAMHTHYYGSDGELKQNVTEEDSIEIIDLTTKSFRKVVTTPGQMTLVVACGGSCGMAASAVVRASRLLRNCGVNAVPARLDVTRHDLPWQYMPAHLPAFWVFPPHRERGREAESVSLPREARAGASALVALALRALGTPHNVRVRLLLCHQAKRRVDKKTCLRDVKEYILSVIDRSLKYWNRTSNAELRKALLGRLIKLHTVSFSLNLLDISDIYDGGRKLTSLYHALDDLAKNWEIDPTILIKKSVKNAHSIS